MSSPTPANVGPFASPPPAPQQQQQPSSRPRHLLKREGAFCIKNLTEAEQSLEDAMNRLSSLLPEVVLGKRTRQDGPGGSSDSESDGDTPRNNKQGALTLRPQSSQPSISNVTTSTRRYALKKKLRPEQRDELDTFLLDTALGRQAKLFACALALESKLDAIRSAAPPYQLSDELKTNIDNYSMAVMLSVNIRAYKGGIPRNHVLDILKRYPFELPVGIEHDYADWEKISIFVGYSLTQSRARVKKLIKDSVANNTNIFTLAELIVHATPCRTTVQLCSRIALMRAVYIECNGSEKYWNLIDTCLEFIRSKAGPSTSRTSIAFTEILKADRAKFGVGDEHIIGDTVADEWQRRVDDVVAGTADTA